MLHLRRPSTADLAALGAEQAEQALSYADVGGSLTGARPAGHHHARARRVLGHDPEWLAAGAQAIRAWAGHRHAGAALEPPVPPLEVGRPVAFAVRIGPCWITAACRVVAVVDEPDRFGFAYGTLPHHPESGEESFLVVRDPESGEVALEITAFSRPAVWFTRVGGPVGRAVQRWAARRYLDGFQAAARAAFPA